MTELALCMLIVGLVLGWMARGSYDRGRKLYFEGLRESAQAAKDRERPQ